MPTVTIPSTKIPIEDILDLASRYNDRGALGESVLYFASDILNVSTDTFMELVNEYNRKVGA